MLGLYTTTFGHYQLCNTHTSHILTSAGTQVNIAKIKLVVIHVVATTMVTYNMNVCTVRVFFRCSHQIHNERRAGSVWFSCSQIHIKMSDTKTRTPPKGFYTSQAIFMIFHIVSCIFLDPYHPSAFFLYILFAVLSVTFANFHFCINIVAKRTENEKKEKLHTASWVL